MIRIRFSILSRLDNIHVKLCCSKILDDVNLSIGPSYREQFSLHCCFLIQFAPGQSMRDVSFCTNYHYSIMTYRTKTFLRNNMFVHFTHCMWFKLKSFQKDITSTIFGTSNSHGFIYYVKWHIVSALYMLSSDQNYRGFLNTISDNSNATPLPPLHSHTRK